MDGHKIGEYAYLNSITYSKYIPIQIQYLIKVENPFTKKIVLVLSVSVCHARCVP